MLVSKDVVSVEVQEYIINRGTEKLIVLGKENSIFSEAYDVLNSVLRFGNVIEPKYITISSSTSKNKNVNGDKISG